MKHHRNDEMLFDLFRENRSVPDGMQARLDACYDEILAESKSASGKRPVRKGVKTALLIAAVVALLAGTTVAARELNLFDLFGAMGKPAYTAVASSASAVEDKPAVIDDEYGHGEAWVDSIYYNGQELAMTYSWKTGEDYYGDFVPDEEMLSRMEKADSPLVLNSGIDQENRLVAQFMETVQTQGGEPVGFVFYTIFVSDHTKTPEGVDAGVWGGGLTERTEEGVVSEIREFESPLPEELQDLEKITLTTILRRVGYFYYYDGQDVYFLREVVLEKEMVATAYRTEAETVCYTGSGEFEGVSYTATAEFGTFGGTITVTAEEAVFSPRCFVVAYDDQGAEYTWTEYIQRQENVDTLNYHYDSEGYQPEELTIVVFDWPEDVEYFSDVEIDKSSGTALVKTE